MKPEPQENQQKLSEDLKKFERLPATTRELLLLGNKAEKTTGEDRADADRQIKLRSDEGKQ
jgi:hypothetical protein